LQLAHAAPYRVQWRPALTATLVLLFLLSASILDGARAVTRPAGPASAPATADAADGSGSACTGRPPFKAVIVVGPVGGATARFRSWANEIASAAKAAGMAVCKVYSPNADADTVKAAARGADLFVALMHGNGYPKPDRSQDDKVGLPREADEATAHGLGLNAARAKGDGNNRYYGAEWVRRNLRLAPSAIVILSHMCFTSGNSEDFHKLPSYALAVEHVDNFAAGFLDSGSYPSGGHPSVVMALQSQDYDTQDPKGDLIRTLMTRDVSLDRAFMTTYTRNTYKPYVGTYLPNFGAIGTTDFYVTERPDGTTLRSRGRIHIDPDLLVEGRWPAWPSTKEWDPRAPDIAWLDRFAGRPKKITKGSGLARFGYVRSIAGDLSLTAADWRAGAAEGSDDPPPEPGPTDPDPDPVPAVPATVTIPRIRGMTRAQAKAALIAAGLKVKATDQLASSTRVARDRAINTYPSYLRDGEPRRVKRGTTVQIRMSTGPGPTASSQGSVEASGAR
jgi:hypothetical protein